MRQRLSHCSKSDREHRNFFIEGDMAEATASTASSIEMSSITSTLGRRDPGLGSAVNGYDEERAEPNARAGVGGKGNWKPLYKQS